MPQGEGVKNVLLDIEGTVCPISFVKDTLFPYALKALPDVLATQWDSPAFRAYRDAFPEEHRTSPEALQEHVEDLTKRDVKIAYLKNLQGYLWEDGYKSGAYATPLFPDVAPQLKAWRDKRLDLAIYSSGSVFAQKLLFQHVKIEGQAAGTKRSAIKLDDEQTADKPAKKARPTDDGEGLGDGRDAARSRESAEGAQPPGSDDLRYLMIDDGWFDTTNAGLKTEASSYTKIVDTLKWEPRQTLFLTDSVKEYDAAAEAGLQVLLVDRPGNAPVSDADRARLEIVESLDDIQLSGKNEIVGSAAADNATAKAS